jgi:protein phosphatase
MQLQTSSVSDIGKIRENNEDSYLELNVDNSSEKLLLLVVADGMGGHKAGEVASKTVVKSIEEYFKTQENGLEKDALNSLKNSIIKANQEVIQASNDKEELRGMGSTCTAMLILNNKTFLAHVGDSRAYLARGEKITQLTKDHTLAEKMFDSGIISKEEAKTSPHRNMLIKAVGISDEIEVETYEPLNINEGDIFLLCSDGLTEHIDEEEIFSILNIYEPDEACKLLVNIANKRGGKDNITVQIAKVVNSEEKDQNNFLNKLNNNSPFRAN